ncbi:hypothetical protein HZC34_03785 [Candidatus Saganbacteria bacterium]|nr:hypothetical protein [Candidatus Saganbacteria bacterium]
MFRSYLNDLAKMIFRPILFFTVIPEGKWYDKPASFAGFTSALLSFVLASVIFVTQFMPIGSTMFEKVQPSKIIIASPVMAVLGLMFFAMTFALLFGLLLVILLILSATIGSLLFSASFVLFSKHESTVGINNEGFLKDIKASLYSSGSMAVFILPILMILLTKSSRMDFTNFKIGYNMLYSFWVLYMYGILAIIARKNHDLPKWKAFAAALLPIIFLILVGVVVSKVVLIKISSMIA